MSQKLAPCGTRSARNRHRRNGETCEACKPLPRSKAPCGTANAYKRGCRCDECRTAHRDDQRAKYGVKEADRKQLAPCGTRAARARHKARCEECETCRPKGRAIYPCGTWQARRRHARNGEQCDACAKKPERTAPTPTPPKTPAPPKPCGTEAALKRHRYHNEPPCEPCLKGARDRAETHRRQKGIPERLTIEDIVTEARFLLNAGEGEARILAALGYTGRTHSLRTRLTKAGHHQLATQILNPWDLAA
jgi:hypothetical protein